MLLDLVAMSTPPPWGFRSFRMILYEAGNSSQLLISGERWVSVPIMMSGLLSSRKACKLAILERIPQKFMTEIFSLGTCLWVPYFGFEVLFGLPGRLSKFEEWWWFSVEEEVTGAQGDVVVFILFGEDDLRGVEDICGPGKILLFKGVNWLEHSSYVCPLVLLRLAMQLFIIYIILGGLRDTYPGTLY